MNEQRSEICGNCKYYYETEFAYGKCKRFPPKNLFRKGEVVDSLHPIVTDDNTCGEFCIAEETFDGWWNRVMKEKIYDLLYENEIQDWFANRIKVTCKQAWEAAQRKK